MFSRVFLMLAALFGVFATCKESKVFIFFLMLFTFFKANTLLLTVYLVVMILILILLFIVGIFFFIIRIKITFSSFPHSINLFILWSWFIYLCAFAFKKSIAFIIFKHIIVTIIIILIIITIVSIIYPRYDNHFCIF